MWRNGGSSHLVVQEADFRAFELPSPSLECRFLDPSSLIDVPGTVLGGWHLWFCFILPRTLVARRYSCFRDAVFSCLCPCPPRSWGEHGSCLCTPNRRLRAVIRTGALASRGPRLRPHCDAFWNLCKVLSPFIFSFSTCALGIRWHLARSVLGLTLRLYKYKTFKVTFCNSKPCLGIDLDRWVARWTHRWADGCKDGLGKPTSLVPGEIGCTCKTGWKG